MKPAGRTLGTLRLAAVVVPITVGGVLYLLIGLLSAPAAALILVLLVVGAAATGDRPAGILAALSSAAAFDFFLTAPYLDLHMANAEDIELAVLLLIVGVAVTELALWGSRHRAVASERSGFMSGVMESADVAAGGRSVMEAIDTVSGHIRRTIGAEMVTYQPGAPGSDSAVIQRDGTVIIEGATLNVTAEGFPTDRYTAVPVIQNDRVVGHFLITTATRVVRPRSEQLRVTILLADQIARRRLAPAAVRRIGAAGTQERPGWPLSGGAQQ